MTASIQDRTPEFRAVLQQAQKRANANRPSARQNLLTPAQQQHASTAPSNPRQARTEFARSAANIGRGITGTMEKLHRLAQLARRKTLFDDRPVEIAELTFVIKQDLSALNNQISALQTLSAAAHPNTGKKGPADQEGEHEKNVVVLLQGKLASVGANFKETLEVRTKNIQASRSRQENFVSSVGAAANANVQNQLGAGMQGEQSASPLYSTPRRSNTPKPGYSSSADVLNLDPGNSALMRPGSAGPASDRQLLLMEEAAPQQNMYIQQRGEAIEAIERTINELGGIFGQLASMVSQQGEMIQRIDEDTIDTVENVEGAQRELLKYWNRMSGNRWLIAKMMGVLMIFFLLWVLVSG